jgi:hypothetical protein
MPYFVNARSGAFSPSAPVANVRPYLLHRGLRDIKAVHAGLFSPGLMRKKKFLILERTVEAH